MFFQAFLVTLCYVIIACRLLTLSFSFILSLTVWPGFITSILQYETSIMLCIDVSHKVLRSETVLDIMYNLHSKVGPRAFHDSCSKELIGQIVLTK